ncbi:unnamed protein product, partial [Effrenium voratum]
MACFVQRWGFRLSSTVLGGGCAGLAWSKKCHCQDAYGEELTRISYTSTMRGDPTSAFTQIQRIVQQSAAANLLSKVSGHMCYDAKLKQVWQVLEGSPEVIERLWAGICKDERHVVDEDTVKVKPVDHRAYPVGWGMRCTHFDPGAASQSGSDCTNLMQLMYKSVINEAVVNPDTVTKEIVPHAVAHNNKNGITGWMLYNDRNMVVYQVLEGPPESVER